MIAYIADAQQVNASWIICVPHSSRSDLLGGIYNSGIASVDNDMFKW